MPWHLPPPGLRHRVATAMGGKDALGRDVYDRLESAWQRATRGLELPGTQETSQWRWEWPRNVEGVASLRSLHWIGLARDVGWRKWSAAQRETVARRLWLMGYPVEGLGGSAWKPGQPLLPGHLHFSIPRAEVERAGLGELLTTLGREAARRAQIPVAQR